MQLLSVNDNNEVSSFILTTSGIINSLYRRFMLEENKNMSLEEKNKAITITCIFISHLVDDFASNQGDTWLIGNNTIMPSDRLVIYKNFIINMSFIESHIDTLNKKLDLEFNHKYDLEILL